MYVVCTHIESGGTAWLTARKIRGPIVFLAYTATEQGCRHGADGQGGCLINAGRAWWWIGVPVGPMNLGHAILAFGQWAFAGSTKSARSTDRSHS